MWSRNVNLIRKNLFFFAGCQGDWGKPINEVCSEGIAELN